MTGHGITYKGKKHDEMEVEVVGVDNEKRQYQVMIMRSRRILWYKCYDECKIYAQRSWVKTKIIPIIWEHLQNQM